jgi:hypothetical protein
MQAFFCTSCKHRVFFENVQCTNCQAKLAFLPDRNTISALEQQADGTFATLPATGNARYRMCQNAIDHGACTWAVRVDDPEVLCRACRLNDTIPDLSQPDARDAWLRLEVAKRRLICNLISIGLPVPTHIDAEHAKLRFAFLKETGAEKVFTGQSDGLITINIAEADDPFREKIRQQLGENYRTLLGHFRHEVGHYYWDQLIKDSPRLEQFHALFGDETQSYQEAVDRHYKNGPPPDWRNRFVSAYATMHPWEDWAETWAHYLHLVDTLETARAYDMVLNAKSEAQSNDAKVAAARVDPQDFESMYRAWVPFTLALNSLNRSMGHPDAYPFVLSEPSVEKLRFVHGVVQSCKVTEISPTDNTSQLTRSTVMKAVATNPTPETKEQATGA